MKKEGLRVFGSRVNFSRSILKAAFAFAGLTLTSAGLYAAGTGKQEPAVPRSLLAQAPAKGEEPAARSAEPAKPREGELLVKFKTGMSAATAANAHGAIGATVKRSFPRIGWQHVKLPAGLTTEEGLERYKRLAGVVEVEPNYVYRASVVPNDTSYSSLWGMTKIGAPTAWDKTTGNSATVVAVIDTGVDYTHADLADNMWRNPGETAGNGVDDDANGFVDDIYGIDALNNDSNPLDDEDHGTHCAGTIGAVGNNGVGVAGVNWNVRIMALKFLDYYGYGETADAITCLNYVATMKSRGVNIRVTNNSWGGGPFSQALKDAFDALGNAGIVNVCAAGNDSDNTDTYASYPASFDSSSIISVASSDQSDAKSYFSNYGATTVDLAAPGSSILSTVPGGYYSNSGTSMAAPHVTGAVALLTGAQPSLTVASTRALLQNSVDQLAQWSGVVAWGGRLNLARAMANVNASFVSVSDVTVAEGNSGSQDAVFTVTVSPAPTAALQVSYSTADGTARAGSDYTATNGTLSFAAGEASKEVRVPVSGDTLYERNETFTLTMTGEANTPRAIGTITNDDAAVGGGGRVVFVSGRDGNSEIYSMNADGSNVINLSRNGAADSNPHLSKDGSKIVFTSSRDGNSEIYSMNVDGSAQTRLTNTSNSEYSPAWSPDGTRIAFQREGYVSYSFASQIYLMNADGSNAVNISGNNYDDYDPSWSPDGTRLVFSTEISSYYYRIAVMNADGTGRVVVSTGYDDRAPAWSPDGTQIAYQSEDYYYYINKIYVMNVDGTGAYSLSGTSTTDMNPAWSPDGSQLAFDAYSNGDYEILTMFVDGTGRTNISNSPGSDSQPSWATGTPPGNSISGRLVTPRGAGLRDVAITRTSGGSSVTVFTSTNGDFAFQGVPNGTYTLAPSRADTTFSPSSRPVSVNGASVTGQNFTGTSPYAAISGFVSNSKGRRMANISLRCSETGVTQITDTIGRYSFARLAAGTYTIAPVLTGYSSTPGSNIVALVGDDVYDQNFAIKPVNDDMANALTLTGNTATARGTNIAASRESGEPYHSSYGAGYSVWYQWTAPETGRLVVDTANSGFDTVLAVYTGNSVGGLTLVTNGSNNDDAGLKTSRVVISVTAGTTYRIAVDSYSYAEGSVALNLNFTPVPAPVISSFTPASSYSGSLVTITGTGFTDVTAVRFNNYTATYTIKSATQITAVVPYCTVGPITVTSPGGTAVSSGNFTLIPTYQVRGSATTGSGAALPGATITLTGTTPSDNRTTTTDSTGAFTLNDVVIGAYTLQASLHGYAFTPAERSVTVSTASVSSQNFVGAPVSVPISGRITTADGTPLSSVSVIRSGSTTAVLTDANGNYSFTGVTTGTYSITASRAGWTFTPATRSVTVKASAVTEQDFTAYNSVYGRVTLSGVGVPGVDVTLSGRTMPVQTDANGYYSFSDVAPGTYTVTPSLSSYSFAPASRQYVVGTEPVMVSSFVATRLYNISGRVTNVNGLPVANVEIAWHAGEPPVLTNANGNYTIPNLTAKSYVISPSLPEYVFNPGYRSVTVSTTNVTTAHFVALRGYSVSGMIRDKNRNPIVGQKVTVTDSNRNVKAEVTTDSNGFYLTNAILAGNYTVAVTAPAGYLFQTSTRSISIFDADIPGQDFVREVAYRISGKVIGPDGLPASNAAVKCEPPYRYGTVSTADDGTYTFYLMPEGSYTVWVSAPSSETFSPATRSVEISGADKLDQDFAAARKYSIGGTVRDSNGVPISGVRITRSGDVDAATTDSSGKFTLFNKVVAGEYTLTASHSDYVFSPATRTSTVATAHLTDENFTGTRMMSISGRITTATGSGIANVTVIRSGSATPVTTDSNGEYRFDDLPADSYVVTPTLSGYSFTPPARTVILASNNSSFQDFRAVPLVSLSGRIATAAGDGVSGAVVTRTNSAGQRVSLTTGSDGAYSFTDVPVGSYTLSVTRSGFSFAVAGFTNPVTVNADRSGLDYVATPVATGSYSIRGNVATYSGTAMPGITVTCSGVASVTTDAGGNYVFPSVPAGSVVVAPLITPSLIGVTFAPASPVLLVTGNRTNVNFQAAFTVSGRLANHSGAGIPNVLVQRTANGSTTGAYTDAQGNYSFNSVRSGTYTVAPVLTPSMTGMSFTPTALSVTVDRANVTNKNFNGMFSISGRVANSAGLGFANVQVQRAIGSSVVSVFTDAQGNYSFSGVRSGTYTLSPVISSALAGVGFTPMTLAVTVDRNNWTNQNFVVVFSVSGRITTSAGTGIANAAVRLNNGSSFTFATTDSGGYYRFASVPAGTYTLTPILAGRTFTPAVRSGVVLSTGSAGNVNFVGSG